MIRTISAEFDCVDSAERAAAAVKNNFIDIARISIKQKNINSSGKNQYNSVPFINLYNPQPFPSNPTLYGFPLVTNISNQEESNQPKEVILKISCSNNNLKKVSSILTSYGGLQIKEE